jgi:hypothetical protein
MIQSFPFLSKLLRRDRGLSVLLVFLALDIFFLRPLADHVPLGKVVLDISFTLILMAGALAVAKTRWEAWPVLGVALGAVTVRWGTYLVPGTGLASLDLVLTLLFHAFLALVILAHIFGSGPISIHRVLGAVAVYLLLGMMWAYAYELLELSAPGAFARMGVPGHPDITPISLTYFSYATLSTVGYGDITPVHPIARSLAMLEALTGQLFPAILIARLVAMELQFRNRPDGAG